MTDENDNAGPPREESSGQVRAWVLQLVLGEMTNDLELGQDVLAELIAEEPLRTVENVWSVLTQFAHEVALLTSAEYARLEPGVDPVAAVRTSMLAYQLEARADGSAVAP